MPLVISNPQIASPGRPAQIKDGGNISNQFGLKPIQAYVVRNFVPHTILNGRTSHTAHKSGFNSLPMYGQEIYSTRDVASWPVSRQGFVVVLYAPPDDQAKRLGTLVALAFRFDQPTLIVAVLSNYRFDLGADRAALFFLPSEPDHAGRKVISPRDHQKMVARAVRAKGSDRMPHVELLCLWAGLLPGKVSATGV